MSGIRMESIRQIVQQMITISEEEMEGLLRHASIKTFSRKDWLSLPGKVPDEIFFINRGLIRVMIADAQGVEHTTHFALENQFIADYSGFILRQPAQYALQAIVDTETVVLPRRAIEWGYAHLREGQNLGRLVAEFYFLYLDNRIVQQYSLSPKERYDHISQVFPNIHNRVPQHMIASYLGITSVHLSRLKKTAREKA